MKIYVIGIGLIGGSMALELKELFRDCHVVGVDQNETHLEEALALGIIDEKGSLETLAEADRVILSIPVKESLRLLPTLLDQLNDNALLWDVGSTKEQLCKGSKIILNGINTLQRILLLEQNFLVPKRPIWGYLKGNHKFYVKPKNPCRFIDLVKDKFPSNGNVFAFYGAKRARSSHGLCFSSISRKLFYVRENSP